MAIDKPDRRQAGAGSRRLEDRDFADAVEDAMDSRSLALTRIFDVPAA